MNTSDPKPVVFIAFANDRDERIGYLGRYLRKPP
jgi:hypothetical protein